MVTLALLFILLAWTFVLAWYVLWGLLLVPYRLIRRSQRKQRLADLRHQEMLNRMNPPGPGDSGWTDVPSLA